MMTKLKIILFAVGLTVFLGISILITPYVVRQQIAHAHVTAATVEGFTTVNDACRICANCVGPYFGFWCECQNFAFTGAIVVNYTASDVNCLPTVKVATACGNTVTQALSAVKDSYYIGQTVEGYSRFTTKDVCEFSLVSFGLLFFWILSGVFWGLFITLSILFVWQCCKHRRTHMSMNNHYSGFTTNSYQRV